MIKKDFTELKVWQEACEIFDIALKDIQKFPKNRIAYYISDQWLRSIGSISVNIAEGHGRGGDRELQRSLIIARGEMSESRDWLYKVLKLNYITLERVKEYETKYSYLSKMITNFIGEIRKRL